MLFNYRNGGVNDCTNVAVSSARFLFAFLLFLTAFLSLFDRTGFLYFIFNSRKRIEGKFSVLQRSG
jgi:hypothetical protein